MPRDRIFLASDLHLGVPSKGESREREMRFIQWLDFIQPDCQELYLMGDIFDFWFEYKKVVPKGFVRVLGKLAELHDNGIPIHFMIGNHDLWVRDYFSDELGWNIHKQAITREFYGRKFFLHHGDALGPGDQMYKIVRWFFHSAFMQWSFRQIHPDLGIGIADYFSRRSRKSNMSADKQDYGDQEFLIRFCKAHQESNPHIGGYIFGHRHMPRLFDVLPGKLYINLGDWVHYDTYLEIGPERVSLRSFDAVARCGHELSGAPVRQEPS